MPPVVDAISGKIQQQFTVTTVRCSFESVKYVDGLPSTALFEVAICDLK